MAVNAPLKPVSLQFQNLTPVWNLSCDLNSIKCEAEQGEKLSWSYCFSTPTLNTWMQRHTFYQPTKTHATPIIGHFLLQPDLKSNPSLLPWKLLLDQLPINAIKYPSLNYCSAKMGVLMTNYCTVATLRGNNLHTIFGGINRVILSFLIVWGLEHFL